MDAHNGINKSFFPQQKHIDQLYSEYPDALFILNYRYPQKLLRSLKNWNYYDRRFIEYTPHLFQNIDSGLSSDERICKMIENHYNMINKFFSNKPNVKFVKFDIEKDPLSILGEFIDLKNFKKLPHKNKSNMNPIQ